MKRPGYESVLEAIAALISRLEVAGEHRLTIDLGSTACAFETLVALLWGEMEIPREQVDNVVRRLRDLAVNPRCTTLMSLALIGLARDIKLETE